MATEKFVSTVNISLPEVSAESCSHDSEFAEPATMVVPQIVFSEDTKPTAEDSGDEGISTSEMAQEEVRRIFSALPRGPRRSGSTTPKSDGSNEFSFSRQASLQPSHSTRSSSPSSSRHLSLEEELQQQLYYTTSVAEDWKQRWRKEREELMRVRDLWGSCERQCMELVDGITLTFENSNKELKDEIRSLLDHNDRLVKENNQQQEEFQEQLDRLEMHKHKLQNECIELNRQACMAENELRECSSENVYLRKKVTILESDKSVICQRLNEVQRTLDEAGQEYQDTISLLENQNSSLCEQLKQVRAAFGEARRESEARVIELTNKLNRYEVQYALTNGLNGHHRPRSCTWSSPSTSSKPNSEFVSSNGGPPGLNKEKPLFRKLVEKGPESNGQLQNVLRVTEANHLNQVITIDQTVGKEKRGPTEVTSEVSDDSASIQDDPLSPAGQNLDGKEDINLESSIDSGCVTSLKNGSHLPSVDSLSHSFGANNDLYGILLDAALARLAVLESALAIKNKPSRRPSQSRAKGFTINVDCDDPTSMRIEALSPSTVQTDDLPSVGDNEVFKSEEIVQSPIQPRVRSRTMSDSASTSSPTPASVLARSLPSSNTLLRRVGLRRQFDTTRLQRSSVGASEEKKTPRLSDLGRHIPLPLISTSRQIRSLSMKSQTPSSPPSPRSPDVFFQSSPTSDTSFNASITSLESQSSEAATPNTTPRSKVLLVRSHTLDKQVIKPVAALRKRSISEMDLENAVLMDSHPILRPIQHSRHLSDEVMTSSSEDVGGTRTSGFCALRARRNGIIDVLPDALPRNIKPAKKSIKAFDMFRKKSMDLSNTESKKERRKSKSLKKLSRENPFF